MEKVEISDQLWDEIKEIIPGERGKWGGIARDSRDFINTVLTLLKNRECYSFNLHWGTIGNKSNSYNKRFTNWRKKGVWEAILPNLLVRYNWFFENDSYELLLTNYDLMVYISRVRDYRDGKWEYAKPNKVRRNRERSDKALEKGKIKYQRKPYKKYYNKYYYAMIDDCWGNDDY